MPGQSTASRHFGDMTDNNVLLGVGVVPLSQLRKTDGPCRHWRGFKHHSLLVPGVE
jgi:hypothetical protein